MLAWVHQSIAVAREFLESLSGLRSDGRMVGSIRKFDSIEDEEDWICELMDLAFGKLCMPLRVRMMLFFFSFFKIYYFVHLLY
jgi:conserved oligomeric Golgi complex subunit 6